MTRHSMHAIRRAWMTMALTTLLIATSQDAFAGAWAQEDQGLYLKLSYARLTASEQFKDGGDTLPLLSEDIPGSFSQNGGILYAEYGVLPKFTLTFSLLASDVILDSNFETSRVRGLGDAFFGARYQFLDGPLVTSVSGQIKTPTGYTPDNGALRPVLGNGVLEADGRLLVGKGFAWGYFSVEAGFRWRGSRAAAGGASTVDFSDEIPYAGEIGYTLRLKNDVLNAVLIRATANGIYGLGDPGELEAITLTPTLQRFLKVGPSIIFVLFDQIQFNVDYMFTPTGVNTLQSRDLFVGIALDKTLGIEF
ncbi:MAG: hypothetical protein AAGI01_09420 [Myxococcota bacterium]